MIETVSDLIQAIDEFVNSANDSAEAISKFIDSIPDYLVREMAHPRKKPRGSIRRARRGDKNAD